jgi:hypothetical protein
LAILALLLSPAAGDEDKFEPAFSRRLDFKVGVEMALDAAIERLQLNSALVETQKWDDDDYLIVLKIEAYNPEGHDRMVHVRATFSDAEGKTLAKAEKDELQIEEEEAKTFKVTTHLDRDPASALATFLLEIDAWLD